MRSAGNGAREPAEIIACSDRQIVDKTAAPRQKGRVLEPFERTPSMLAHTFIHGSNSPPQKPGEKKRGAGGRQQMAGPSGIPLSKAESCLIARYYLASAERRSRELAVILELSQ